MLDAAGSAMPVTLATRGRGPCSVSGLKLANVSADGEVLVDEISRPCATGEPGLRRLLTYGIGAAREIVRKQIGRTYGDGVAPRCRSAPEGLEPRCPRHGVVDGNKSDDQTNDASRGFAGSDLDPAGNVIVIEVTRVGRRGHRWSLRAYAPTDPPRGGRILGAARGRFTVPMFCGEKLMEHRLVRGREALLIRDSLEDRPRVVVRPRRGDDDLVAVCDERTLVAIRNSHVDSARINAYPLDHQ